jgi:hypothetical protein
MNTPGHALAVFMLGTCKQSPGWSSSRVSCPADGADDAGGLGDADDGDGDADGADDAGGLGDAGDRDGDAGPAVAMAAITAVSAANPAPMMTRAYRQERRPVRWPGSSWGSLVESPGPPAAASAPDGWGMTGAPHPAQNRAASAVSVPHSRHRIRSAPFGGLAKTGSPKPHSGRPALFSLQNTRLYLDCCYHNFIVHTGPTVSCLDSVQVFQRTIIS